MVDWIEKKCYDPNHDPPKYMVIREKYTHTCPSCGKTITIFPDQVTY